MSHGHLPPGHKHADHPPIKLSIEIKIDEHMVGTCNIFLQNIYKPLEIIDGNGNVFSFIPSKKIYGTTFISIDEDLIVQKISNGLQKLNTMQRDIRETMDDLLDSVEGRLGQDVDHETSLKHLVLENNTQHGLADSFGESRGSTSTKKVTTQGMKNFNVNKREPILAGANSSNQKGMMIGTINEINKDTTVHPLPSQKYNWSDWFECKVCGETFTRTSHYEKHVRVNHIGVKPFHCDACGKGFSRKDDMKKHYNSRHLGIKQFVCKVCGEGFVKRNRMENHHYEAHVYNKTNN